MKLYLDVFKVECNMKLVEVFLIVIFFMGVYFKDIKDVKDLKEGDVIVVLNDLMNEFWVLKLFEKVGVLKVDLKVIEKVIVKDVIENLKKLKIVELEVF